MILKRTIKRLSGLYDEVRAKGGARISPRHVQQILDKIDRKERKTREALLHTEDPAKRDKLIRKLAVIGEQRKRGGELLELVREGKA